jgi:hypothetical protein
LFNGHYYYLTGVEIFPGATFRARDSTFLGFQGHLVTITSQAEFDFLKSTYNKTFWIAATDEDVEGEWRWEVGPEAGSIVSPTFWAPGQQSNFTAGDCAVMNSTGWSVWNCIDWEMQYVIEYEYNPATPITSPRTPPLCLIFSSFAQTLVLSAAVLFNGHHYQVGSTKAAFADALVLASQTYYKGQLGHLATVSSRAEYDFIAKTLGARNAWLAATDVRQEDNWLVAAGPSIGTTAPSNVWAVGEPLGGASLNCALAISEGGMSTGFCSEARFYVIEYECQTSSSTECERTYSFNFI